MVIGGTASQLGGGKFANGAVTGAYIMMFNCNSKKKEEDLYKKHQPQLRNGHIGPDATGYSFAIEMSAGIAGVEVIIYSEVTFHVGPDAGDTFWYQTVSSEVGVYGINGSISYTNYNYRGDKSNFGHETLLGEGYEIYGGFYAGGSWGVSARDDYGARTYSQSYSLGGGLGPAISGGYRKTNTTIGRKVKSGK